MVSWNRGRGLVGKMQVAEDPTALVRLIIEAEAEAVALQEAEREARQKLDEYARAVGLRVIMIRTEAVTEIPPAFMLLPFHRRF
eukprot:COSAG01_NODE_14391_length_1460_cov_2.893461_3_plen_84_part_00